MFTFTLLTLFASITAQDPTYLKVSACPDLSRCFGDKGRAASYSVSLPQQSVLQCFYPDNVASFSFGPSGLVGVINPSPNVPRQQAVNFAYSDVKTFAAPPTTTQVPLTFTNGIVYAKKIGEYCDGDSRYWGFAKCDSGLSCVLRKCRQIGQNPGDACKSNDDYRICKGDGNFMYHGDYQNRNVTVQEEKLYQLRCNTDIQKCVLHGRKRGEYCDETHSCRASFAYKEQQEDGSIWTRYSIGHSGRVCLKNHKCSSIAGESCTLNGVYLCTENQKCNKQGKCEMIPRTKGEFCSEVYKCKSNLTCLSNRCVNDRVPKGQSCNDTNRCLNGLSCVNATCVAR